MTDVPAQVWNMSAPERLALMKSFAVCLVGIIVLSRPPLMAVDASVNKSASIDAKNVVWTLIRMHTKSIVQ